MKSYADNRIRAYVTNCVKQFVVIVEQFVMTVKWMIHLTFSSIV